ncbi:MAG: DUF3108 domain-containing protein [Desulfamplus sp.]|nr:DUF3108 domain-containing protein [Desulfamplus sp.]
MKRSNHRVMTFVSAFSAAWIILFTGNYANLDASHVTNPASLDASHVKNPAGLDASHTINPDASNVSLPMSHGEKLLFQIRWGMVQAGEAVLHAMPFQNLKGTESHRFVLELKTSSAVDRFYKVRDKIESYTDLGISRSLFYSKKATGRDKRDVKIYFDWNNHTASYSNFNQVRESIGIEEGAFDPLAALYGIRSREFSVDSEISFPITDGKRSFMGKARIVGREKIELGGITYDTYLVEPELVHFDGVFKKSKNPELKIWMTADHRKMPVKIECKVLVGSITGELVDAVML